MPGRTDIEWADYSSNPLKVKINGKVGWHCVKYSPGCAMCYAEAINRRFGTGLTYNAANGDKVEWFLDDKELRHILTFKPKPPFKNGRNRPIVFPFDMTDLFQDHVGDNLIDRFMDAVRIRKDVDFMVLTKRAGRMQCYLKAWCDRWGGPLPNLWAGVSAEDQQRYDLRMPDLANTPAAKRFVSLEPLIGDINLDGDLFSKRIALAIVGGESGRGARECNTAGIDTIVRQCLKVDVNVYVKQLGSNPRGLSLTHSKGGDMTEWPENLRIRQMPV